MANLERKSFLNRVTKGRLGKADRAEQQPAMSGAEVPIRLTDDGKTLAAMLSAYDAQQAGMTPEEKDAQNEKIVSGKEGFTVSYEELQRRRAGVEIQQLKGISADEAMGNVETLEAASEEIPGIKAVLRMLAEKKGEEEK